MLTSTQANENSRRHSNQIDWNVINQVGYKVHRCPSRTNWLLALFLFKDSQGFDASLFEMRVIGLYFQDSYPSRFIRHWMIRNAFSSASGVIKTDSLMSNESRQSKVFLCTATSIGHLIIALFFVLCYEYHPKQLPGDIKWVKKDGPIATKHLKK